MEKIDFIKEITRCFKEQYFERWKKYEDFFGISWVPQSNKGLSEAMITYSNMVSDLDLLITLIKELEKEE